MTFPLRDPVQQELHLRNPSLSMIINEILLPRSMALFLMDQIKPLELETGGLRIDAAGYS